MATSQGMQLPETGIGKDSREWIFPLDPPEREHSGSANILIVTQWNWFQSPWLQNYEYIFIVFKPY